MEFVMIKHEQFDSDYPLRDFLNQFENKYDDFKVQYKGEMIDWYWWWTQNPSIELDPFLEGRLKNEI